MTQNVEHANNLIDDLRTQYQVRISQLQQKITEQEYEIKQLQEQIRLLSNERYYDC